ncbi:GntR family transcriptional regulator [Deinococcus radiodurans]|nr:GntR family transcriptional regulator [Deinococcus radiodurans]
MPDLPFAVTLNRAGPSPIHLQLAAQLREAALAGQLLPGSLLPGTRTLARDLGVTRGVVEAAYALLSADGTLQGEVGRGTRVSRGVGRTAQAAAPSPAWFAPRVPSPGMHSDERPGLHFRTGVTSAAMLNAQAWKRAWAYAARQPVGGGYADAAGLPELRAAVSAFVGRSRGWRPHRIRCCSRQAPCKASACWRGRCCRRERRCCLRTPVTARAAPCWKGPDCASCRCRWTRTGQWWTTCRPRTPSTSLPATSSPSAAA